MKSKPLFKNRFVAFVDILGFQDIVQRMETTPELFDTVRDALTTIRDQSNAFGKYRAEKRDLSKKRAARGKESSRPTDIAMTAFSDCYVVSEGEDVWRVLASVQALGTRLLSQGILCRGGIVRGPAYHRHDILFGPAIVDAYKLEKDVAKYPRILVTEEVRKAGWYYHEGRWREQLFTQDHDGCWFLNLLAPSYSQWKPLSNDETSSRELLRQVRTQLVQSIRTSGNDLNLLSKFHWLGDHFNEAEPTICQAPPRTAARTNNAANPAMLNPKPMPWVTLFASSSKETRRFAVRANDPSPHKYCSPPEPIAQEVKQRFSRRPYQSIPTVDKRDPVTGFSRQSTFKKNLSELTCNCELPPISESRPHNRGLVADGCILWGV